MIVTKYLVIRSAVVVQVWHCNCLVPEARITKAGYNLLHTPGMRHFLARHHQGHFDSLASNSPFIYHNRPNNRGKVGLPYWAQHLKRPDEVDGSDFYRGGLAASLVTLLGLAANSCKTLHDLQQQLCSAPKDNQRLVSKVETFRELLAAFERESRNRSSDRLPPELQQIWTTCETTMQTDLQAFGVLVNKPDDTLTGLSITRKNFRARARKVFSEQAARKCEDAFDRYKGVLDSVQGILNRFFTLGVATEWYFANNI